MSDTDFNPTDAVGLAAWFARAEANATILRQRLATFGGEPRSPAPECVREGLEEAARRGGENPHHRRGASAAPPATSVAWSGHGNRRRKSAEI